jgi:hypothetical protein
VQGHAAASSLRARRSTAQHIRSKSGDLGLVQDPQRHLVAATRYELNQLTKITVHVDAGAGSGARF